MIQGGEEEKTTTKKRGIVIPWFVQGCFWGPDTRPGAGTAEPSWHGASALLLRAPAGMKSMLGKVHKSKEGLQGLSQLNTCWKETFLEKKASALSWVIYLLQSSLWFNAL